jgi:hypothetical protein
MQVVPGLLKQKLFAQCFGERFRRVPRDWQPAAFLRAVRCERRDHDATVRSNYLPQMSNVTGSILVAREEMEDRAVVPDVHRFEAPVARHIGFDPDRHGSRLPQPDPRPVQRHAGDIQHSKTGQSLGDEVINEARVPPANIENSGCRGEACVHQHLDRQQG